MNGFDGSGTDEGEGAAAGGGNEGDTNKTKGRGHQRRNEPSFQKRKFVIIFIQSFILKHNNLL
jgi:hypothetical protein